MKWAHRDENLCAEVYRPGDCDGLALTPRQCHDRPFDVADIDADFFNLRSRDRSRLGHAAGRLPFARPAEAA
jgi:hypothetical protein